MSYSVHSNSISLFYIGCGREAPPTAFRVPLLLPNGESNSKNKNSKVKRKKQKQNFLSFSKGILCLFFYNLSFTVTKGKTKTKRSLLFLFMYLFLIVALGPSVLLASCQTMWFIMFTHSHSYRHVPSQRVVDERVGQRERGSTAAKATLIRAQPVLAALSRREHVPLEVGEHVCTYSLDGKKVVAYMSRGRRIKHSALQHVMSIVVAVTPHTLAHVKGPDSSMLAHMCHVFSAWGSHPR